MTEKKTEKSKKENQQEEENLKKLKERIEELEEEKEEYLNGWKRTKADFMNYKKDEEGRLAKAKKEAKKDIIMNLLEVLDDFELAEKNIPEDEKNAYISGLLRIKKQLEDVLRSEGVEEMEVEGKKFNPNVHEAVEMIEAEGDPNEIVEEVRKGYLMEGELLRPARVKIIKNNKNTS